MRFSAVLRWILSILSCALAAGAAVGLANCQFEGPYEVRQCAKGAWFAPVPGDGGAISSVQWWGIGFGNATVSTPPGASAVSPEGSGFLALPLPGQFIGIDSGAPDAAGLDLADAATIPDLGAPPGATCFSSAANGGAPGADSCIDVNRNDAGGGGSLSASDNYLNVYWSQGSGYHYGPYYNAQLDPPMGALLQESSGRYFALAFFASEPRPHAPGVQDIRSGQYNMGLLVNGGAGPSGSNVVPWQRIPHPAAVFVCSGGANCERDPNAPGLVLMTWTAMNTPETQSEQSELLRSRRLERLWKKAA